MSDCDESLEEIEIRNISVNGCSSESAVDEAIRAEILKQVKDRRTKACGEGTCSDRTKECRLIVTELVARMLTKVKVQGEQRNVDVSEITQHYFYSSKDGSKVLYGGNVRERKTFLGPLIAKSACMCLPKEDH